jgi:cytochrome P450
MTTPEDTEELPQGIQLTPIDPAFRNDPYEILKDLRERAPVHEDRELVRFMFTRHDDVKALLHDREFSTDPRKANPGTFSREVIGSTLRDGEKPPMLLMDEPDHRRLRGLVSAPFKPKAVERWRPHIRDIVQSALDKIEDQDFDLIERFAGPVPTVVIAELLGIDPQKHDEFKRWSDQMVQVGFNPFPTDQQKTKGEAAGSALEGFFLAEIERRSANPGEDLLSDMIRADVEGESLSTQEIVSQCRLLLIAGNVTTTDLIGNGVNALLDNPRQMQKLREDPTLIANAVEEVLRFDSPVIQTWSMARGDNSATQYRVSVALVRFGSGVGKNQRSIVEGRRPEHFFVLKIILRIQPGFLVSLFGE